MNLSIEYLVDFSSGEQIAEFVTTADGYNIFHCILQEGSNDIAAALEDTLHRGIDAGGYQSGKIPPDNEYPGLWQK